MIDLRGIANSAIQSINPNITIRVQAPDGFTTDEFYNQVPKYVEQVMQGNVQAMSNDDLKQIDSLNLEGTIRAVYLYGNYSGIMRVGQNPSTRMFFTTNESGFVKEREWNVFKMLEAWQGWCKVAVVLQEEVNP